MTWILGVLPFSSTLLGGLAVFRLQHRLHVVMAFAAGVLVTTAFVDLLPEAYEQIGGSNAAFVAGTAAVVGYLLYSAVEAFIHQGTYEHGAGAQSAFGWIGPAGLVVHSTLDGLAIGLGFQVSGQAGLLVLLAVLVHDFADGLNVVTLAFAGGRSRRTSLLLLALDAAAPVVGILLSQLIVPMPYQLGLLLGVFAGAFVAIGAGHLLPEAQHHEQAHLSPLIALTVLGGLLVVATRLMIGS